MFKMFRCYLKFLLLTIIINYCHGDECKPFSPINVVSLADDTLDAIIQPIKSVIPVFNSTTLPDFDSFIEKFDAASNNEDIFLNITQILTKYGYGAETHQVQTSDGYLLDMFRIPSDGPAVFLMHGLLCSSNDFISSGPDRSLPYLLADLGFDVWLGNSRGNLHGRKHVNLTAECKEFWDFSWDEIGRYDLPAMIDYVLKTTNQEKLAYIGHSQGCTAYLVMTSELPEYNDKISVMVALSAVSYLKHTTVPAFILLAPFSNVIGLVSKVIGLYEFLPRNQITDAITTIACGNPTTAKVFCNNLLFIIYGFDYAQVNATYLPVVYSNYPAGCATKQLVHYGQEVNSGKFCQFDYGVFGNIKKYGQATPPDYPINKVTSKIALFHADNDLLFTSPDRERLTKELPNVIESYRVPFSKFTHFDFLFANDVRTLVYDKVVEILINNM